VKYNFPCISSNHLIKNYWVSTGRRYKQQLLAEIIAKEGGEQGVIFSLSVGEIKSCYAEINAQLEMCLKDFVNPRRRRQMI
jgi:hypothetical protein